MALSDLLITKPGQLATCYRHPDQRAVDLIHDDRGCVYTCRDCTAWRSSQSIVQGHRADCPEPPSP